MRLDHVEIFVPARREAAAWYERVFGCAILPEHLDWATDGGPLMISNDAGETMLALFRGRAQGDAEVRGLRRLAFRVDAGGFLDFLASSSDWRSPPLGAGDVQDHQKSLSVYFSDPWGNPLEVTTYDYAEAREALAP